MRVRPIMASPLPRRIADRFGSAPGCAVYARAAAAVGVILLVAWLQLFVGVHELRHIGQADASSCKFALIASTVGGTGTASAPGLVAPSSLGILTPLVAPSREQHGEVSTQQARAPPVLA